MRCFDQHEKTCGSCSHSSTHDWVRADSLDEESRQLLTTLSHDIERALGRPPERATSEATAPSRNSLEEAAVQLEADHPALANIVRQLVDAARQSRHLMRALVALSVCLLGQGALAAEICQPQSEYDAITKVVTDRFYDRTFRGLDWPARVAAIRIDVTCGDDANTVAAKVNRLLSSCMRATRARTPRTTWITGPCSQSSRAAWRSIPSR